MFWIKLIVDDGINGFIFEHSKKGLIRAMKKALTLSDYDYKEMSNNAVEKIKKAFPMKFGLKNI